jgi:PhoH-like ATPase
MPMKRVIVDTNILMSAEFDIAKYEKVYVPILVLEELDNHKVYGDDERKFKARRAMRALECATNVEYRLESAATIPSHLQHTKIDNQILSFAKDITTFDNESIFLVNDLNLLEKAKSMNIPCSKLKIIDCDLPYLGYRTFFGGTYEINKIFEDLDKGIDEHGFLTNEYLIVYNQDLDDVNEYRFDGSKLVDLRLPPSKVIKALNSQQRLALDLLYNKDIPIKIIAGGFGSGKTMLSVKTGLHLVTQKEQYKTLMFLRNPLPADGADIGFLPGDKADKIADYCRPFLQYVENEKDQFYVENLIRNEKIKMDVVSFLKGVSLDDSFVIMDEAEDLNGKLIKLVGSRIGKNSCIVFTGDYKQSENKYKYDNGLTKLIKETKGNELVGIVVLDEDVRSSASKVFSLI